jgi:hypothetical protein
VQPLLIIIGKVTAQSLSRSAWAVIVVEIDLFILDAAPEPFGKDIVEGAASAIHADPHFFFRSDLSDSLFFLQDLLDDLRFESAVWRFLRVTDLTYLRLFLCLNSLGHYNTAYCDTSGNVNTYTLVSSASKRSTSACTPVAFTMLSLISSTILWASSAESRQASLRVT